MQNPASTTPAPTAEEKRAEATTPQGPQGGATVLVGQRKHISMHEGIAAWCDCCSCAAEPYWLEVAEELGIEPGSDYELEEDRGG